MKTSQFAMGALTCLLLGAASVPASAADLGGGCCADLEERVAELEATTARKGNRVVSLQIYGQVNKGLMVWDDGVDSDAFIVDNTVESSRFGFQGKAQISKGLTAGFQMEIELVDAFSNLVTQGDDEGESTLSLRQNYWYLESERFGRISVGHGNAAADAATEVVLSNSLRHSDPNFGAGLKLRYGTGFAADDRTLGEVAGNLGPDRNDLIRYDSPSIYGFILSSSWGDNDYADVALRFAKEFKTFKVATAIAYIWDEQGETGEDFEQIGGSISIAHVPTGLFAAFQAGSRDVKATDVDPSFWYVQGGIEKKWLSAGDTTFYGEYGRYDDFHVLGAETTRFGFGVNQKIDSAAMDVYAHATFWSFDGLDEGNVAPEDITTLMVGSRIQF